MTTGIEWTDETWNPLVGCTHCSPGCDNCYAANLASGRLKHIPLYSGLAERGKFTGEVRTVPSRLEQPLHWRKPRRVFVNSMSDLFHPDVPVSFIVQVFHVMARAPQHTFQILTKRPQRMAAVLTSDEWLDRTKMTDWAGAALSNVWLGTSVENQRYADLRIPHLLTTPAAVRFLSVEPLLGPVDLEPYLWGPIPQTPDHAQVLGSIDWVIVGGESGSGARPMYPAWATALRDQCVGAEVPFLFKQWGEWAPPGSMYTTTGATHLICPDGVDFGVPWGGWAKEITAEPMRRFGKKAAGRELDGRTWDEYPQPWTTH